MSAGAAPRVFSVALPAALLGAALGALVAGVLLLANGRPLLAIASFALALVAAAGALEVSRRERARGSGGALAEAGYRVRGWARFGGEAIAAQIAGRVQLLRLRRQMTRIARHRAQRLLELGEAVYLGRAEEAGLISAAVRDCDRMLAKTEDEMCLVVARVDERVRRAHAPARATELVEREVADRSPAG